MSASKRGTGASIGPKILLVAVVFVAGVIGISGIYPQVIDAEWVPDTTGTRLPVKSSPDPVARTRLGTAAAIPLPPSRVATTGQGTVSSPRPAPTPDLSPLRAAIAAVETPPVAAAQPAVGELADAEAKADALPAETAPDAAKPAEKPKLVVKKKVVVHHQRNFNGAYAQYGGWGGWPGGGGWGGFGGGGGYRRF